MSTYQTEFRKEVETKLAQNMDALLRIRDALKPTIEQMGLAEEFEKNYESYDSTCRLILTNPEFPDFRVNLSVSLRQGKQIASTNFWLERSIWKPARDEKYPGQGYTTRYSFASYIGCDELHASGFSAGRNVGAHELLRDLHASFSATKNIKLILNDILPSLRLYQSVVEMVGPRIDAAHAQREATLCLMQDLARACGYPEPEEIRQDYGVRLIGGKVTVCEFGDIRLETVIDQKQLQQLITEHKKSKTKGEA